MLPEAQKQAFESFVDSVSNNDVFEQKTTIMIKMAVAMALGCYP